MFNNLLNSVKDIGFVRVSKENWDKIEKLFASKEETIKSLKTINQEQEEELFSLRKYKENDELLYSYEQSDKKLRAENEILKNKLLAIRKDLEKMDKTVNSVMSLESAYLKRINKVESQKNSCPRYETKGDFLLSQYSN